MNRSTARSNLPRGPVVKLTSLAGRRCPLRRTPSVAFARGRRALPLCLNGDKSWADCLFGEGVWTAHKSIKSIRVLCRDGLAWPGLKELGPIFCEGLCESECCHSQQSWLVYSQHQYERREEGWKACIWPEPVCHIWATVHIGLRCSHQWTCEDCRAATLRPCLRVRFTSLEVMGRKPHYVYTDKTSRIHLFSFVSLELQRVYI